MNNGGLFVFFSARNTHTLFSFKTHATHLYNMCIHIRVYVYTNSLKCNQSKIAHHLISNLNGGGEKYQRELRAR